MIGAYGTAYYSIGVLIPVIHEETGWSTGALSGGFSLALLGQGLVAVVAVRVFDRLGAFALLLPSIVAGSILLPCRGRLPRARGFEINSLWSRSFTSGSSSRGLSQCCNLQRPRHELNRLPFLGVDFALSPLT